MKSNSGSIRRGPSGAPENKAEVSPRGFEPPATHKQPVAGTATWSFANLAPPPEPQTPTPAPAVTQALISSFGSQADHDAAAAAPTPLQLLPGSPATASAGNAIQLDDDEEEKKKKEQEDAVSVAYALGGVKDLSPTDREKLIEKIGATRIREKVGTNKLINYLVWAKADVLARVLPSMTDSQLAELGSFYDSYGDAAVEVRFALYSNAKLSAGEVKALWELYGFKTLKGLVEPKKGLKPKYATLPLADLQKALAIETLVAAGIDKEYEDRAKALIQDPSKLQQGTFGVCGLASLMNVVLREDPLKFVDLAVKTAGSSLGTTKERYKEVMRPIYTAVLTQCAGEQKTDLDKLTPPDLEKKYSTYLKTNPSNLSVIQSYHDAEKKKALAESPFLDFAMSQYLIG